MRLGLAACLLAIAGATPAQAAGIALVLAVDVSESVSSDRYVLQHDGIARAFEAPQLVDAIAAVPEGIEALVLEWSDPDKIAVTVGWTRIANRGAAAAFSTAVRGTQRTSHGLTAIGSAMLAAAAGDRTRRARQSRDHHQRPGDPQRGTVARGLLQPQRDRWPLGVCRRGQGV